MIGIIAAMQSELDIIRSSLCDVKTEKRGGILFYKGQYKGVKVVCAVCGIGKVFAAMCTEAMIIRYKPDVIVNTGVAGALSDKLHRLDCTIAKRCVQHDMDTSALGDPVGMVSGVNKIYFESDERASSLLFSC